MQHLTVYAINVKSTDSVTEKTGFENYAMLYTRGVNLITNN